MLRKYLTEQVANWELLGYPALLERFVLRNGKVYTPRARIGFKQKAKQCFKNAAEYVARYSGVDYVEGFVIAKELPFPLLHAWVTTDGNDAMDPTLDAATHEYMGVVIPKNIHRREMLKHKVYGVLDPGLGLNTDLIFELDPELKTIVENIIHRSKEHALPS